MRLLITSNGINNSELETALEQLTDGKKDLRIAIIPTAGEPIEWAPDTRGIQYDIPKLTKTPLYETNPTESPAYKTWIERGFNNITFVSLRDDPKIVEEKLLRAELINIPGGDVDYLVMWAKKAKLGNYLKKLLNLGTICVTSSAGNGVLCPNIGFRWWKPGVEIDAVESFGIIDFMPVVHQREDDPEKSYEALVKRKKYMQDNYPGGWPWQLYLVQDGQAIKVDGDSVEHIGPGVKKFI